MTEIETRDIKAGMRVRYTRDGRVAWTSGPDEVPTVCLTDADGKVPYYIRHGDGGTFELIPEPLPTEPGATFRGRLTSDLSASDTLTWFVMRRVGDDPVYISQHGWTLDAEQAAEEGLTVVREVEP